MQKNYKLLTPGPLTTTDSVKQQMLFDHCTWDSDYMQITEGIRARLLELGHCDPAEYTVVLMQGSGTFGVESVLTSVVGMDDKVLLCTNGAYGDRQVQMCDHAGVNYVRYNVEYDQVPDPQRIEQILDADPSITHVSMVHSETTSGLLNDIQPVGELTAERDITFIVDAMSSFGGMEIPVQQWHIDFLVSSANKCIQGVPGFSFIIARRQPLEASKGQARSLSLDLWDQWHTLEQAGGKWRYTSPTHVVLAFAQALEELAAEGGIPARAARYAHNNHRLITRMCALGFRTYLEDHQGPFITTFYYPDAVQVDFADMYAFIKERGYAIYPGKLTNEETFRVANMGEIYTSDIDQVTDLFAQYLDARGLLGKIGFDSLEDARHAMEQASA
ncbi:2-aminoethylphosphonate--pyruvate transaminase [Gleimia hominis]|uniref:2-aminoethylphosphonate--pyruvate transaminase n=1 Tax=Gleimia hominis TaxID=595468 RepID=UPI000C7FE6C4|nr:2-aminoethylphosphonate--pyruvate transaminase [Gleimia hominis]WIK64152.1 2-aminoethylphosphonate--pyruvate transaminase [Gleimia hominis]